MGNENQFEERLLSYFDQMFIRAQANLRGTEAEIAVFRATVLEWYMAGASEARLAFLRTMQDQHARMMREVDPVSPR